MIATAWYTRKNHLGGVRAQHEHAAYFLASHLPSLAASYVQLGFAFMINARTRAG